MTTFKSSDQLNVAFYRANHLGGSNWGDKTLPKFPSVFGEYDSEDADLIAIHAHLMKRAGIQIAALNWEGRRYPEANLLHRLMTKGSAVDWVAHYEVFDGQTLGTWQEDFSYLRRNDFTHLNYAHVELIEGEWIRRLPIVFVHVDPAIVLTNVIRTFVEEVASKSCHFVFSIESEFEIPAISTDLEPFVSFYAYAPDQRVAVVPEYALSISPHYAPIDEKDDLLPANEGDWSAATQLNPTLVRWRTTYFNDHKEGSGVEPNIFDAGWHLEELRKGWRK